VVEALARAISAHDLPREPLLSAIDARVFDLYHDPMPDRTTLEAYCGESGSVLLQLIALGAGAERGSALSDACGHGGVALRMVDILRRTPFDRARGKCPFPVTMLAATGLDANAWLADAPDERHARAISAFSALAREHLAKANKVFPVPATP
jgi:phytoene synthase